MQIDGTIIWVNYSIHGPPPGRRYRNFFPPFRPGMAPGGLGTPKIDHEPYIWTDFFQVSSNSIVIGPFSRSFSVGGDLQGPLGTSRDPCIYCDGRKLCVCVLMMMKDFLILLLFIGFVVMTNYAAALATDALLDFFENGHAATLADS